MNAPFFIGWAPGSAKPIGRFLALIAALLLGGSAALALALAARVDDPGDGLWVGDREYTGVLVEHPYPLLVTDPTPEHPNGHAVMLSGGGKRGVQAGAAAQAGKRVRVTGGMVRRGDLEMVFVNAITPTDGAAAMPQAEPLGTWRVVGEICDGKCTTGAMRPGDGLAHKACANVCILGGVPPVLVTAGPVAGRNFLLMGDPSGRALPDSFRDHVGVRRRMEGTVHRIGDLLVFHTDVTTATVASGTNR